MYERDKVVDVEELLQPDHRQVRLQAAAAQRRRAIRIILVIIEINYKVVASSAGSSAGPTAGCRRAGAKECD